MSAPRHEAGWSLIYKPNAPATSSSSLTVRSTRPSLPPSKAPRIVYDQDRVVPVDLRAVLFAQRDNHPEVVDLTDHILVKKHPTLLPPQTRLKIGKKMLKETVTAVCWKSVQRWMKHEVTDTDIIRAIQQQYLFKPWQQHFESYQKRHNKAAYAGLLRYHNALDQPDAGVATESLVWGIDMLGAQTYVTGIEFLESDNLAFVINYGDERYAR
ncbi:hypothetical protein M422DRAFT_250565 [Sphaerobolus stellatus SS14]|uniref:Uncharacterized protein n=1 Tax=Sphaerobolus stellatus (strain SS14) TaxID=990650 RepID=A0A0C9VT79_SPHS4|nr:hypothetical protein M422DRAFT_250565 [Sphaerobolus stellatus SS14]